MKLVQRALMFGTLVFALLASGGLSRAEVVEEIIAWVNGDIITRSEYDEEEKARVAEAYRGFSGDELDAEVERARKELLLSMIDRKILLHHAQALGYDMSKMGDAYVEAFMQQQGIASEEQLRRLAEGDGMTVKQVKDRLVELYGPQDIIDMEVVNRISVSETEIETFYADHPEVFHVDGEVTLREIVLLVEDQAQRDRRREEAQGIWQRASSGEDFETLVGEVSEAGTASNGGTLGPLKRADLTDILGETAFTLQVGSISGLMETPYGFHIVKVESRMDDRMQALDDVRDAIRNRLEEKKFRADLMTFMEKARSESEWCVKPKHHDLLSIDAPPPCEIL